jgi:hypothetical protein
MRRNLTDVGVYAVEGGSKGNMLIKNSTDCYNNISTPLVNTIISLQEEILIAKYVMKQRLVFRK